MSQLEDIRFGYGPRLGHGVAGRGIDPDRLMAQFDRPDPDAAALERPGTAQRIKLLQQLGVQNKMRRAGETLPEPSASRQLKDMFVGDTLSFVLRPVAARNGFVERLANLWANRLTVAVVGNAGTFVQAFRQDVAQTHLAGRFADMLRAALWHPAMQVYLNQNTSVGPGSSYGMRKGRGLNENLAREFLELHSMGSGYTQSDVTELARLLAGMHNDERGRGVDPSRVEPGVKRVLGERFRGDDPEAEINRLVDLVAARPETAQSVGLMLARHFIADQPPTDLVDLLAQTYRRSDGALLPVYRALLEHPAAADPDRHKLRSPQEFVAAGLRAVGLTGTETKLPGLHKRAGFRLYEALSRMGQPIFHARRPDGWPEVAAGWLTPPMMAARIDFAADLARAAGDRADPVALTEAALGDLASPQLRFAVQGAEQRWEGVAVLVGSPEFMRR